RGAREPTSPDEPRPWAPTGVIGTTPTDRSGLDTEDRGWPQPPGDASFPRSTQAFEAPPGPPAPGQPSGRRRPRRRLVPLLGLAPGLASVLTTAQGHRLQDLVLTSPTPGYDVSVYVADSSPSQLSGWGQPVTSVSNAPNRNVVPLHGRAGSNVLVWFTRLSQSN